eukprot:675525-Rhodomonas_salina.1
MERMVRGGWRRVVVEQRRRWRGSSSLICLLSLCFCLVRDAALRERVGWELGVKKAEEGQAEIDPGSRAGRKRWGEVCGFHGSRKSSREEEVRRSLWVSWGQYQHTFSKGRVEERQRKHVSRWGGAFAFV